MKSGSILKTLWPLMKLMQIMGACPLAKDESSPYGFKALSFVGYLAIIVFFWIGIALVTVGVFCYLFFVEGLNRNQLMILVTSNTGSKMDSISFNALSCLMMGVTVAITIENFKLKDRFTDLMQLFQNYDLQECKLRRKYFLLSVIFSWFLCFSTIITPHFHNGDIELNLVSSILITFLMFIVQVTQITPIVGFIIIYSEACNQLNFWIERLIEKFESKQSFQWETIQECSHLLKDGLKKTQSTFSTLLFWISLLNLVSMIFCAYLALVFISKLILIGLSNGELATAVVLSSGTNAMIQTLCYINFLSDDVTTNLQNLKDCISDIDAGTKRKVMGQCLESIQGFSLNYKSK